MKWLAATALLLAGCASQDLSVERATGTVVLSLAAGRNTPFEAYDLRVARSDGRNVTAIPFIVRGLASDRPDFASGNESGLVAVLVLPAGDYEVKELSGYSGTVWWEHETTTTQEAPFRFTVRPGSEQYLGRFEAVTTGNDRTALSMIVTDKAGDDVALAQAKYAGLGNLAVSDLSGQQANSEPAASALATP
jgi:hypothetical protein